MILTRSLLVYKLNRHAATVDLPPNGPNQTRGMTIPRNECTVVTMLLHSDRMQFHADRAELLGIRKCSGRTCVTRSLFRCSVSSPETRAVRL